MDYFGWIQLALFVGLLVALTKPMGLYLVQVLDVRGKPFLAPVIGPVERLLYFLLRVEPQKEQDWKQYTFALIAFSLVSALFTYAILRLQHILPLNPQGLGPVGDHLSFNTFSNRRGFLLRSNLTVWGKLYPHRAIFTELGRIF